MKKVLGLLVGFLVLAASVQAANVADLIKQLKAAGEDERRAAAKSLGEMGAEAKTAVPELTQALKDSDLFVRRFSAQALGEIGPDAQKAVPALKAALADAKKEVAAAAAEALGKVGPDGVKVLGNLVKDPKQDEELRRRAIIGLAKAGADVKPALPQLTELLTNPDFRVDVVSALGELGPNANDDKVVKGLQDLMADKGVKKEFRQTIQDTLRKITGKGKDKK